MFRCARIEGLDTSEGLLLFGKEHFYIVDGFTLLRTKEVVDIDSLPAEWVATWVTVDLKTVMTFASNRFTISLTCS